MRYRLLASTTLLGIGVCAIVASAIAQAGSARSHRLQSHVRPHGARPRTLVQVRGRIGAFAQDGDRIAWLWPDGRCEQLIQVRRLSTGFQRGVASSHGPTCQRYAYVPSSLALAGTRAIWAIVWQSNTEDHVEMVSGSVGDHRDAIVGKLSFWGGREERPKTHTIPVAGDGSILVYADVDDGAEGQADRGVRRVIGRKSTRIAGAIGAISVAASGRRLAILSDTNRTSTVCTCYASNSAAAWSPLGNRIAYSAASEGDFRFSAIKVVAADGTNPTKLTNQTLGEYRADFGPDWSPDGSRLAFTREGLTIDSGWPGIWTMNADGSNQQKLIRGSDPAWSPDGMKIAFVRDSGGISVINADGSGLRQLTSSLQHFAPDWSPDGSKLVFTNFENGYQISVMNADGTDAHSVAAGEEPAWSPNGSLIAFTHRENPSSTSEVRVVNPEGGNEHRVAEGQDPSWSPDGTRLAVTRNSKSPPGRDIFLIGADGSAETRLTVARLEPIAPTLQLRDARSGRLVARIVYRGQSKAVALSPSFGAVLARDETGTHVLLYDARNGSAAGSIAVRANATDLSISGGRVVFRSGRSIWLIDALKKHVSLLATAATVPIGLSIDGRRVAWAENLRSHARIRGLNIR